MNRLSLDRLRQGFTVRMGEVWWHWSIGKPPLTANIESELLTLFGRIESHRAAGGWVGACFPYSIAPCFDSALHVLPNSAKACIFLFESQPETFDRLECPPLTSRTPVFSAQLSFEAYQDKFAAVRSKLAQGDSYQVNLTFPLRSESIPDPAALFSLLTGDTPPPYAAYIPFDSGPMLSLSPELFFEIRQNVIRSRPMKGTRPRSAEPSELRDNPKDRAENLMIVDMIRNDLGRIAKTGTVRVPKLFEIEDHGTVWQMTSTVEADTEAPLREVFAALFPCASIVGAPKIETTRIIAETENWSRGIYTGAIGVAGPDIARFSVAIRTIETTETGAVYGVGSGVVWDSEAPSEYQECLDKAEILFPYGQDLQLLETLRWEPGKNFYFEEEHLARLLESALALGWCIDSDRVKSELRDAARNWTEPARVRLVVSEAGIGIEASPVSVGFNWEPTGIGITATTCPFMIDSQNPWLRHKTTNRRVYETAAHASPADDVILINEQYQVTEFTIGNVVILADGALRTPPLKSGLLPGVFRQHLLDAGSIAEGDVSLDDLWRASAVFRINSVRGWEAVKLLTIPS